jgi:hypothetical protein
MSQKLSNAELKLKKKMPFVDWKSYVIFTNHCDCNLINFTKSTVDLLQMLEFNINVTFPVASFFTVILALVGKFFLLFTK